MSKEKYRSLGASQHWVDDFSAGHIKAIGTIKVVGATGLVLPAVLDIAPVLVPLAACGLMLVMAGAATTRFRRNEWKYFVGDLVYLSLFAFVAFGRSSLEPSRDNAGPEGADAPGQSMRSRAPAHRRRRRLDLTGSRAWAR